jgi:hypothetical protein
MARVITFSRTFPKGHPKEGKPTYFVEKFWSSIGNKDLEDKWVFTEGSKESFWNICDLYNEKHHTIRSGNRWKVGDKFSPRVWSGKPYQSKMIQFAPDTEIKKVFNIEIKDDGYVFIENRKLDYNNLSTLAENDGLGLQELLQWFKYPKPFTGQIICWNENINY